MRRLVLGFVVVALVTLLAPPLLAQEVRDNERYPSDVLERYWECRERTDLSEIQLLLQQHRQGRRIDATVYRLPKDDLDDRSLLTIEERLFVRRDRIANRNPLPTSGPLQYPHQMREVLDHYYEVTGQRPDCSKILEDAGLPPEEPESLTNGWTSDLNLTSADSNERGEVDVTVDFNSPGRVLISSCPSGASPDSSSNFITASSDWGSTWSRTAVGNNSGTTWECDPVSYYQRSTGRVYHSKIGCNTGSCGQTYVGMRYSANNGGSWTDCGRPGAGTAEDRQWHVVDNTPSSACYGNIYTTWHNSNQEIVTRSTSNCSTWVNRTNLTSTYQAITPDISVAADGHVYVVWQNYADSTFKIAGSSDCGATWASPSAKTLKSRLGDWSNNLPAQCQRGVPTQPNVDVDRCTWSAYYGRVYVILQDFSASCTTQAAYSCSTWDTNYSNTCNFDFFLMYSDNGGSTWSTPVNITSGEGNKVDHFLGYMRVDEKDGSIYLGYHRSRLNPASAADRQKTHYFAMRSTNGGTNWETLQLSTQEGNERSSGASSFERGDYQGFSVYDGVVWPAWVDRRGGSGEEELVTRKVCTEPAHRSERAPTFTTAATTATAGASKVINVGWTLPDATWGDAGQSTTSREFQLYVDGALNQDNISSSATSTTYTAADCTTSHTFRIRAVNSCGVAKDYAQATATATGCSGCNPTVNVTPNGPLTLCQGTGQTLTAGVSGGTGPFTYQWTRDGANISGATASTYSANDTGTHSYNCKVTGSGTGCTAVTDPSSVSITWQSTPTFAGLQTVTAPGSSTCTLNLAWTAGTACSGGLTYNVYRSTTSGFTPAAGNRIASGVTATSYSDTTGLVSGTTYYYVVRAVSTATGVEETNTVQQSGSPVGPVTTGTWLDDLEPSADAGWTHAAASGTDDWTQSTASSHSSSHSWASVDVATVADKWVIAPAKGLSSTSALTFWHKYTFENTYDGGVIEISTNGGSSWADLGSAITAGGYTNTLSSSYSNPLGGRSAWSGTLSAFTQVSVNLASYAGSSRLIRWRMGTDTSQAGGTWYVDDVQITGTEIYGTCGGGSCTAPTFAGLTSATDVNGCATTGIALAWSAPSNWNDGGTGTRTFQILRGGSTIATVSGTTYAYTDTAAPVGVASTYAVNAVNGCGSSYGSSVTRSATNADTAPAPTFAGLSTVTTGASCSLVLTWSAGTPVCGTGIRYNVYRSTTSGFTPGSSNRVATGITTTTYTDSSLANGTYYYVVRAEDMTTGHSGPSGGVEETNLVQRSGTVSGGGGGTVTLFSDTFESGTGLNGWRAGYFSGDTTGWRGIQTCTAYAGTKIFRFGGTGCTTDYANSKFSYANPGGTAGLIFPAGVTTARLSFWHRWKFETNYDGATLLISTDGSNFTPIPASAIISGKSYTHTTSTYCPPSGGGSRSVFSGSQTTFLNTVVDLDAAANAIAGNVGGAAGKTLWIAFSVITDCSTTNDGWFLDNVQVTYSGGGACTGAYLGDDLGNDDVTLSEEQ